MAATIEKNVDMYKEYSKYKGVLDILTKIDFWDKTIFTNQLKEEPRDFKLEFDDKKGQVSDILRCALYLAGNNKPEALKFLLIAGIGNHPEFAKATPLEYAIKSGNSNLVSILRKERNFYDAKNLEVKGTDDFTKLYTIILKNDHKLFNGLSEDKKSQLLEAKDFKVRPVEVARIWGSSEVKKALYSKYYDELPSKIQTICEQGFKDQTILDTKLHSSIEEKIINKLDEICNTAQEKKGMRSIAGAIVRDAAKLAGVTPNWQQSFGGIKDKIREIIAKHLPRLGFFNKEPELRTVPQELKTDLINFLEPELTKLKKTMKVDDSKKQSPPVSRSKTTPQRPQKKELGI